MSIPDVTADFLMGPFPYRGQAAVANSTDHAYVFVGGAFQPTKTRAAIMRRILLAVDGSDCSLRAVQYCAAMFSGLDDLHITLFHVLPYMPPQMWDPGHIPSEQERVRHQITVDTWFDEQSRRADPIFRNAGEILLQADIDPTRVDTKAISDSTDVAGSILEEARTGGYLSLVLGRCGSSGIKKFMTGSTTNRIINHGAGLTICIVE